MRKRRNKNIVVIGGGTGTSVVLGGLKKYPVNLSAIITTADDGSSSGKLRDEFNMIPPGDIRQCLVALASKDFEYLNERFQQGSLQGHTLGNLMITLFCEKHKDFQQAVDEVLRVTGAQGSLIPMTLRPATLAARLHDGRTLKGEKNITPSREIGAKLDKLFLLPQGIEANPRAVSAIANADVIVVGPGNFFSSILPNLLLSGIKNALINSRAKKLYIANLFTQPGHTDTLTLGGFVHVLTQYIGKDVFEHVLYNNRPIPGVILQRHRNSILGPAVKISNEDKRDKRFIGLALAKSSPRLIASDPIAKIRNPFLHDSAKLARAIISLI